MQYKFIITISLLSICYNVSSNINITNLIEQDTILINCHIAYFGEYGGADEGVIIFKDKGVLKAMYVKYNSDNYNSSSFSLTEQKVVEYFSKMRHDYKIIKDVWSLDTSQIAFVNQLINDLKTYVPENGVSNASEFYQLSIKDNEYVIIDRLGSWDKYKEIHQTFKIEVKKPRRIYFLGIKLKPKEVEYIVN